VSDRTTLTSIGVDVGTTTTHTILSRLRVETPPGGSPQIIDREIRHRGTVRETPLLDAETIDVDRVVEFVERELEAAGVTPDAIDTGAVIVTGETARRENAEPLAHQLADDAGQFVAATAGGALEAVLAGRGSGAATRAAKDGTMVANIDVGGGTTNIAIFDGTGLAGSSRREAPVAETRCLDVGGRLVRFDDEGHVTSISPPAREIADVREIPLEVGKRPSVAVLEDLSAAMAELIVDCCVGPPFDSLTRSLWIGTPPEESLPIEAVVKSGGVGRLVASPPDDPFAYGDLGGLLADALATNETVRSWSVLDSAEDIRATVVGAGTETTTLSGRTTSLEPALLPLQNVPVVRVPAIDEATGTDLEEAFRTALARADELYDIGAEDAVSLSVDDVGSLEYRRIGQVAKALAGALEAVPWSLPVVVVTRQNCAKALGQSVRRGTDRPLVVVDELGVDGGDYLDIGEPMAGGESVPVVVKTLAFGE